MLKILTVSKPGSFIACLTPGERLIALDQSRQAQATQGVMD